MSGEAGGAGAWSGGARGWGVSAGERRRPMSGGLWAVLAWLRGDERDSGSDSDSLSSAGSARTAASFAFLAPPAPAPTRARTRSPPPLAPPTDSYRRRVRDSHLQKLQDRDLTLHRKYGLYCGSDAFTLPHGRKNFTDFENHRDRDRRAASESFPRRTAYVPGKRRAPLPPPATRPHSIASTASLDRPRRHNRKRPAPKPPALTTKESVNKEDLHVHKEQLDIRLKMNNNTEGDRRPLADVNHEESKADKCCSKSGNAKESKVRSEKSFIRQIFENKKRSSTIEPAERILPSISELDRQAAEIIESCKLKPIEQNNNTPKTQSPRGETWFCTRCLRKYDSTVVTCLYCLPEQKRLSAGFGIKGNNSTQTETCKSLNGPSLSRVSGVGYEDKQKLRNMLKEMKDSLPKRPKHDSVNGSAQKMFKFDSTGRSSTSFETETLRIGAHGPTNNDYDNPVPSTSKHDISNENVCDISKVEKFLPNIKPEPVTENVVITQHVVLVAPQPQLKRKSEIQNTQSDKIEKKTSDTNGDKSNGKVMVEKVSMPSNLGKIEKNNLNTPLKISSLLNPVYIPKVNVTENQPRRNLFYSKSDEHKNTFSTNSAHTSAVVSHASVISKQMTVDAVISSNESNTITSSAHDIPKSEKAQESVIKPTVSSAPITSNNTSVGNISAGDQKFKQIHSNITKFNVNQHSRRRDLINQLEQSIAKGDEKAAAEAAVKLAQLRLSCSVLSFASQIMAGSSGAATSSSGKSTQLNKTENKQDATSGQTTKVDASVQSLAPPKPPCNKSAISKELKPETTINVAKSSTHTQNPNTCIKYIGQDSQKPSTSTEPSTSKQVSDENNSGNETMIQVWVEDREATRGPLRLRISRRALMGDLRRQAETSLGLAGALQRWIVGRALCTDDQVPLNTLAGPDLSAPFYLCVVEAENGGISNITVERPNNNEDAKHREPKQTSDVYSELVQLEQQAIVVNAEAFECTVCMEMCAEGRGVVLRECVHVFCRDCLSNLVRHSEEPIVTCPAMGCPGVLQEREIRALVSPEDYERWLARGLAAAESGTRNAFHCRTRDCTGWAFCDPEVRRFPCPVCKHTNCIPCQAIHESETCEQYLSKIRDAASDTPSTSQTDEGTRALLNTLIRKGEALECPECKAVITKKWGCDWVKCSACKTEICWVTRGRRWGPGGKGDTSGGCRCGVDGKRCHLSCGYCH